MNDPVDVRDFVPIFSEETISAYVANVWAKAISPEDLDAEYHVKVTGLFEKAILQGFDGSGHTIEAANRPRRDWSEREAVKLGLRRNIYRFSAAKQYQQVRQMVELIEQNASFTEFKAAARRVFKEFNENYLRTEWATAIGQSEQARQWVEVQENKDVFPLLEYRTQRDSRVRDEHAALDGIILPVDHKFWLQYHPKCGWNCRCFTVSHSDAKVTDLKSRDLSDLKDKKKFPDAFKMNPGADQQLFSEKLHPYFREAKGHKKLKAANFKMVVP